MNRYLALLCGLLCFTMLGCGKQPAEPASSSLPNTNETTPQSGDMYVAGSIGDATYLNPLLATDSASGDINNLVYNGLVKYDRNLKLTGDLAQSWTVSPDGRTILFKLRPNVRWHDGAPFTADDVKFTYDKLIDPAVKTPFGADFQLVKDVRVIDPLTLQVTYKEVFAPALESWGIGIIPKHIYEQGDFNSHPANRAPIGTGPFKFKEWKTDEKIVLDANPDYFEGAPFLRRYIYRIIPDQSVQFLELRNQSIDEMGLTPDQWGAYPEFFKHYNKFRYPSFSYTYLAFNLTMQPFSDLRFRQAVAHAVNKSEIIQGVMRGMGKPATGPFPPQSWAYDPAVNDYAFDPVKSRALLADMGFADTDHDGYLELNGKPFTFTIISNQGNKIRSLAAEIIQSQLKAVGIRTQVRVVEWSAFIHQFIDKRAFEAAIMGWSLSRDPDQYPIWHSSQTGEGQYNFIAYKNTDVDRLLETGRRTFDMNVRIKTYHQIHRILANDLPYLFLYYPEALPVVHKRFHGPEVTAAGLGWNFPKWWVPAGQRKYEIQP